MRFIQPLSIVSVLALSASLAHAGAVKTDDDAVYRPTGKGYGELDDSPGAAAREHARAARPGGTTSNGIDYHGGPVMTDKNGVNVYYIWYGSWSDNSAKTILTDFAITLGIGTVPSWWNISTTYYDSAKIPIQNKVTYSGSVDVDTSQYGKTLTDAQIKQVVQDSLPYLNGGMPDPKGVYFVLTSADVTASSGFCTQYCGWHTHGSIGGADIKYSFVGNPDRCPSSCSMQQAPNGNTGADGMASIIAHELTEAASDPDLNAWYDRRGYENADKCAWTFGTTSGSSGAKYNMTLGSRNFLIQQNWVNANGGYCSLSY
jgi:hypothetical protein